MSISVHLRRRRHRTCDEWMVVRGRGEAPGAVGRLGGAGEGLMVGERGLGPPPAAAAPGMPAALAPDTAAPPGPTRGCGRATRLRGDLVPWRWHREEGHGKSQCDQPPQAPRPHH
jgi:hypothetical protein